MNFLYFFLLFLFCIFPCFVLFPLLSSSPALPLQPPEVLLPPRVFSFTLHLPNQDHAPRHPAIAPAATASAYITAKLTLFAGHPLRPATHPQLQPLIPATTTMNKNAHPKLIPSILAFLTSKQSPVHNKAKR